MIHHKHAVWMMIGIGLMLFSGLLLPGATARSAAVLPPLTPSLTEVDMASTNAIAADGDPTSITMDKDGYTVWTCEYPGSWCVMYSRIAWPFNLGTQDPGELNDTRLLLTFAEKIYVFDAEGWPPGLSDEDILALNLEPAGEES